MPHLPSLTSRHAHLADVLMLMPERSKLLLLLHEEVMRASSPLAAAERESIFAFVSALNGCDYCHQSHQHAAAALGISTETLDGRGTDAEVPQSRLQPLLGFAEKLTRAPGAIDQADCDRVFKAGWSEQALLDVVLVCGLANLMNRLVQASGLELGADKGKRVGEQLAALSYTGILERIWGAAEIR